MKISGLMYNDKIQDVAKNKFPVIYSFAVISKNVSKIQVKLFFAKCCNKKRNNSKTMSHTFMKLSDFMYNDIIQGVT